MIWSIWPSAAARSVSTSPVASVTILYPRSASQPCLSARALAAAGSSWSGTRSITTRSGKDTKSQICGPTGVCRLKPRLAKRRSEAHEALCSGRITRDGRPLKPGYTVRPGDVIVLHYATKYLTVRVREVPERVTPALKAADLYDVVDERRDEPAEWFGRPT